MPPACKPANGSTPAATAPPDFALRYEWHEGSVPPPYHYEYRIRVGPGVQTEILFYPDYPQHNPPVWREEVAVRPETLDAVYQLMVRQGVFRRVWRQPEQHSVGGSQAWLEVTAEAKTVAVPAALAPDQAKAIAPVHEAIRALVSEGLWRRLMTRYEAYQQQSPER
jgi:muconolactone delta-isomerase